MFADSVRPSETVKPRKVAVAIPIEILPPTSSSCSSQSSPIVLDRLRVHLVSSRKHARKYVLPKGGVESGETSRQAAVRELWEEAGIVGESQSPTSGSLSNSTPADLTIDDHKPHKHSPTKNPDEPGFVPRARYTGHEVMLAAGDAVKDDWPEAHERQRKSVTVQEAKTLLEWRRDIHTIFKRWADGLPVHNQT